MINCGIELILIWSKNCVLADITARVERNNNDPPAVVAPTGIEFKITGTKLYVPVVTLSKENDKTFLEQLISGFKRTVKWKKCKSKITIQPQNNNLYYSIDPTFTKVDRCFVLSFGRTAIGNHRDSVSHYYAPNVEIKDFNVLIYGKSFFNLPGKDEEETCEKIMSDDRNNDYTTGNLLDFAYFEENYKLIAVDLSN